MADLGFEELAVVLSLTAKSGASVEIKVHSDDDPMELARKYAPALSLKGEKGITKLYNAIRAKRDEAMEQHAREKEERAELEAQKLRESQQAAETDAFFDDMFGPPPTTTSTNDINNKTTSSNNDIGGSTSESKAELVSKSNDFDDFEATVAADAFANMVDVGGTMGATEVTDTPFDDAFDDFAPSASHTDDGANGGPEEVQDVFEGGFSPSSTQQDAGESPDDSHIIMATTTTTDFSNMNDEASLVSAADNFAPSNDNDNIKKGDQFDANMHTVSDMTATDVHEGQEEEKADCETTTQAVETASLDDASASNLVKRKSLAEQVLTHTGADVNLVETFSGASVNMLEDWEHELDDANGNDGIEHNFDRSHLHKDQNSSSEERRSPSTLENLFQGNASDAAEEDGNIKNATNITINNNNNNNNNNCNDGDGDDDGNDGGGGGGGGGGDGDKNEQAGGVQEVSSPSSLSLKNPSLMSAPTHRVPPTKQHTTTKNTHISDMRSQTTGSSNKKKDVITTNHTSQTDTSEEGDNNKYAKWIAKALQGDKQEIFQRTLQETLRKSSPSRDEYNSVNSGGNTGNNVPYRSNNRSNSAPRSQPVRHHAANGYHSSSDDRPSVRERRASGNFNFTAHRKRHSFLLAGHSKQEREAVMSAIYRDGVSRIERKEKNMEIMRREAKEKKEVEEAASFTPKIFTGKHKKSHARASIVGTPKASPKGSYNDLTDLTAFHFDEAIAASNATSNNLYQNGAVDDTSSKIGKEASSGSATQGRTNHRPFHGTETKFVHDVYDWLAHHAIKHSEVKNSAKRNKILEEYNKKHPFKPCIGHHSTEIAERRRNERLAKYANQGLIDTKSLHDDTTKVGSASKIRTKGYEENKSSPDYTDKKGAVGNHVGGEGLTLGDLASDAFKLDESIIDEHHEDMQGDRGASPSPFDEFALLDQAGTDPTTPNPFDGHDLPHHDEIPSYSPSSYMEAHSAAASVNGDPDQSTNYYAAHNVNIGELSPSKRANALFEYLYHGRQETEAARKEADKKYFNYTFQPTVSTYAHNWKNKSKNNDNGTSSDHDGEGKGVKSPVAFFERMHKTPTHTISQHTAEEVKEIENEVKHLYIPAQAQKKLFTRLTEHYPTIYADRAVERKEKERLKESKAMKSAHAFQPAKTRDLAKKARERSISEVFDVLLASVKYMHQHQADNGGNMQLNEGNKMDAMKDEHQRRQNDTHTYHEKLEHSGRREHRENQKTVDQVAQESHDAKALKQSLADFATGHSPGKKCDDSSLVDLVSSVDGESLLDTSLAQARFLEPKALSESVDIVIREARPEALSRTEFIHRMEVLIQSGVGPPINAILIAPQRPVRYKHSDDIEVETHVTNKLKLEARRMTERLAANKTRAHMADPMKYAREVASKKEFLEAYHNKREQEGCTYRPMIHTNDNYRKRHVNNHKSYQDVVYQRKSKTSKSVMRIKEEAEKKKRESSMGPLFITNSKIQDTRTTVVDSKDGKGHSRRHHHHHARKSLSAFDQQRALIQQQHNKEYSQSNAHSMSHVALFHVRADHMQEDVDANVDKTLIHHEETDYELFKKFQKEEEEKEARLLASSSGSDDDVDESGSNSERKSDKKGSDNIAGNTTNTNAEGYVQPSIQQTSADVASRIEEKLQLISSAGTPGTGGTPTPSTFVSPIKDVNQTQELLTTTHATVDGTPDADHRDIDSKIEEVTKMINSIQVPRRDSAGGVPSSRTGSNNGNGKATLSEMDDYIGGLKTAEEAARMERKNSHYQ